MPQKPSSFSEIVGAFEPSSNAHRGKTIIIRGIGDGDRAGNAIARAFAACGANLALVGSSKAKLKAACVEAEAHDVEAMGLHVHHDDTERIEQVVSSIEERFGSIDGLVNAALVAKPQLLRDLKPQELERTLRFCTVAPFAWMRACLRALAESQGTIISLGSRSAQEGMESLGALASATQGFAALNAMAAREWASLGVTANMIQINASKGEEGFDPLGRACLYLASDEGHDITGETLLI